MPKRVFIGKVTSDKMDKTRKVEIPRKVRHPKYGKFIRQRTICYMHDENNESGKGDTVKLIEAAPYSKLKRWNLVEVIEKSREVDVTAMRAARKQADAEAAANAANAENTTVEKTAEGSASSSETES